MSSPASLKALYSATLKASNTFTSYNFRNYFQRRTRERFEAIQNEQDPVKVQAFTEEARKDLTVLQRAAVLNSMYGGQKLVIESTGEDSQGEGQTRLRGDT